MVLYVLYYYALVSLKCGMLLLNKWHLNWQISVRVTHGRGYNRESFKGVIAFSFKNSSWSYSILYCGVDHLFPPHKHTIVLVNNLILLSVLLVVSPALHLAVMQGRLNNVRTLLTESNIDAEAFNLRYTPFLSVRCFLETNKIKVLGHCSSTIESASFFNITDNLL